MLKIAKKNVLEESAFVIIVVFGLVWCHSSFSIKFCYGDSCEVNFAVTMPMSI